MIGRIVEVADDRRHVFVSRGFMVVQDTEGERKELGQVPLDDISAVSANAHGLSYTNNLLIALAERFLREARVQGQLEHPAVVPVYDLGHDPRGALYLGRSGQVGALGSGQLAALSTGQLAAIESTDFPSISTTRSSGRWLSSAIGSAASPFLCTPSIGSGCTVVRPGSPSSSDRVLGTEDHLDIAWKRRPADVVEIPFVK